MRRWSVINSAGGVNSHYQIVDNDLITLVNVFFLVVQARSSLVIKNLV
jgi:hypothetical protein